MGTLREYRAFDELELVKAPENLDALEASTLSCAALTAWNALYGLELKALRPGDTVLTQGTGGVSIYWIFTFGTKQPRVRSVAIKHLGGGCEWDITKAKEKLGYVPVADQDAVLKKVAESEAKRLGIQSAKA